MALSLGSKAIRWVVLPRVFRCREQEEVKLLRLFGKDFSDEPYRPERDAEIREHLANERTLLAWVRTGVV